MNASIACQSSGDQEQGKKGNQGALGDEKSYCHLKGELSSSETHRKSISCKGKDEIEVGVYVDDIFL